MSCFAVNRNGRGVARMSAQCALLKLMARSHAPLHSMTDDCNLSTLQSPGVSSSPCAPLSPLCSNPDRLIVQR